MKTLASAIRFGTPLLVQVWYTALLHTVWLWPDPEPGQSESGCNMRNIEVILVFFADLMIVLLLREAFSRREKR